MKTHKDLDVWKKSIELVTFIYKETANFPKEELYGVTPQLRRAVVSVPTNIAEGASREHKKEYLHFLYTARASLAETEYLLHLSKRLGYLHNNNYKEVERAREETAKTLHGLINSVRKETKE